MIHTIRNISRTGLLVLLGAASAPLFAQSSAGSLYGIADPGEKVIIKNEESGLVREMTVGEDGKFNFSALPTGTYTIIRQSNGTEKGTETARVNAGVGTSVVFSALQEVTVYGTAVSPIDVTTAQVSTTYSAAQLSELPIMQNIIDVALLAPGTSRGSSAVDSTAKQPYNNLASFGGSSIAENQYYINGFNVTNLFRNIEYSQLPFYAIDTQQVFTGGYGPEHGLSTGGVVSLTTARGTNTWKSGASANWTPNSLRATEGRTTLNSDGSAYRSYSANRDSGLKYDLWGGGPIIEDKLFIFGIVEISKDDSISYPKTYNNTRNTWDEKQERPFGLVKIDWNINEKNLFELTGIQDKTKYTTAQYSTPVDANGFITEGNYLGTDVNERGGWIGIGKYTSFITDNITFSALYGQLKSDRSEHQYAKDGTLISYNGVINDFNQPGCPTVSYASSWASANRGAARPSCFVSTSVDAATGEDERKAGRVDLEYKVPKAFLGTHTLKVGYDADRWSSFYGSSYSGGSNYTYYSNTSLFSGNYVRVRHFQTGAQAGVDSDAYYMKDDWQISKKLLVQLGLRNDSFKNLNGADETYLKQENIWQPRLGIVWDPKGDSTRKLYSSVGIYSLPVTAGISVRGASASIYTSQYFQYSAINPNTGAPTLGAPITGVSIINGENGEVPAAGTFAATNLDPTKQEEFIVGYQQDLGNHWKGGVRATYRNLLKTIDDMCDARPFDSWAARTGFTGGTDNIDNNVPCFVVNPGYGANLSYDLDGNGTLDPVQLSAADIGLPKAKRRYLGLEFTLEKPWSDRWYTQFSYTWSHNYGNAEGLADSDNGQLDIGTTLAFDYPELTVGAYGNLPNDHRNTVKALGAYKPFTDWIISTNVFLQSGKPINCIGLGPDDYGQYGAAYFYCNGAVAPRGSAGTTSTILDIGLGVSYTPSFVPGLSSTVSVFNIFNRHGVTNVDEYYTDSQNSTLASYRAPYSYQPPRYVQLSARYDFNFGR